MDERQLKITRRKLPHWTIENAIYFVTFTLRIGKLSDEEKKIIYDHLLHGHLKFYKMVTFTIMPDHVHLVFELLGKYDLSRVMKGIKGVSSRQLNIYRGTKAINWKEESFDRIIRNEVELNNVIEYIFNNPVKANLVKEGELYPFYYFNSDWKLNE